MRDYMPSESIGAALAYVYEKCYDGRNLSDITAREICGVVADSLSGNDTFYGRFYRQLNLDQEVKKPVKDYIVEQIREYWGGGEGSPSISGITEDK